MNDSKNYASLTERRLDILEAQQAVMAGFISVLLQSNMMQFPEEARRQLMDIYETLFEQSISVLLASEAGFPDVSFQAVEEMKRTILGPLHDRKKD